MKRYLLVGVVTAAFGLWVGSSTNAQDGEGAAKLTSTADKVSYALGYRLGSGFGTALDLSLLKQGFDDAVGKRKAPLTDQEMMKAMNDFQKEKAERETVENKKAGEDFLAANKGKEGVTTTASGLQYSVISEGNGAQPAATDEVTVHYHGTLIDGTVFDSSVERKAPATFPLNRVIKGWTEGLQLMKTGAKYKFFIPSDLAYGPQRRSEKIGPNCALVFEVELISIKGK
jgi:FKBP-type peptidyl-prolyl cis-trans isomerase FklB